MTWRCPEEFEPNQKTIEWAEKKGLTENQIEDELEAMKDYEYPKKRTDWNAAFRTWIRNGLSWGRITPTQTRELFKPQEVSEEQLQRDREQWAKDMREKYGMEVG